TRASILVYISYIAVNIALVFLRTESLPDCLELPSVLIYFPTPTSLARLYVYIALDILGLITLLELANYLYRNGIFSGYNTPRAFILFLNTVDLVRYSTLPTDSSVLFLALFTGPYRLTEDILSVYILTTVLRPTEANKKEIIERLPNILDKLGRILIIVSVSDSLRDRLRDIIRGYLY
ncbi:hypothetical protein N7537_010129, partial [Penicillium hordei]